MSVFSVLCVKSRIFIDYSLGDSSIYSEVGIGTFLSLYIFILFLSFFGNKSIKLIKIYLISLIKRFWDRSCHC